jgi:hypothetical protein
MHAPCSGFTNPLEHTGHLGTPKAHPDTPRENDLQTPEEIITDEEIERVHGNANFGSMSKRRVVDVGVWKYAIGYTCGHTQCEILRDHGLITGARNGRHRAKASLTEKGKSYARALYNADVWPALNPESKRPTEDTEETEQP